MTAFIGAYADCQDLAAEQGAERFGAIATASAALASQHRRLRRLAVSDLPLLLTGETETGKEVYAQAIHCQSKRAGEIVAINCAAIPLSGRDARPTINELHVMLGRHRGNVSGAARELERCTATVWRWLNHFGIDVTSYRRSPKAAGRS